LNYSIVGIAWPAINWYQFQIDGTNSNGFNTAGGPAAEPVAPFCNPGARQTAPAAVVPLPLTAPKASGIRSAQDLSVVAAHRQVSPDFNTVFTIAANTTTVFRITEYNEKDTPDAPEWDTANPFTVDTTPSYGTNVVLRWQPSTDPTFHSRAGNRSDFRRVPAGLRDHLCLGERCCAMRKSETTVEKSGDLRAVRAAALVHNRPLLKQPGKQGISLPSAFQLRRLAEVIRLCFLRMTR
jgi:hypothetical protein